MPVTVNRPGPWTHRYVSAGGSRFHVALAGPEPAAGQGEDAQPLVVLLHGFPVCWWTWREVLPALADLGLRCAAVDLRGFGGSDRPPSGYDLATAADDVAGVVRALGHTRALVIGHGIGGQVGWVMAGRHPGLVTAIAPIGAPHPVALRTLRGRLLSGTAVQYATFRLPLLPERALASASWVAQLLRSWAAPSTRAQAASQAEYYSQLLARPGAARSALAPLRQARLGRATLGALSRPVTVPVLSVQGELDPVQPAQAHTRDTHHVSGVLSQITIRGVGHLPQEEDPARLVDALTPFVLEHTAAAPRR